MVIGRGEIWWADLDEPVGSAPGYPRPVLIIQSDAINASRIQTVIVVPLTSSTKWAQSPGNVLIRAEAAGLDRDSVANVSQILTISRELLVEQMGKVGARELDRVFAGLDLILGR